jgi:small-conductance mechanosensitive channel
VLSARGPLLRLRVDFNFLDRTVFGLSVKLWLIGVGTLALVYVALALAQRFTLRRLERLAATTTTHWDDLAVELVRRTRPYFLVAIAVWAATRVVGPWFGSSAVLRAAGIIIVLLQAGVWGNGIIGFTASEYVQKRATDSGTRTTILAVGYAARFALWGLLIVTALQNFGVQVTPIIASLGIGGIAIALAVQNILGDLFAALAIVLDKPFVVGDSIQVDNLSGTIEHVGLKTTRIRSVNGEQIVISNTELLKSRIRNHQRMQDRRVLFNIDVTFDTPPGMLERIPTIVRDVVSTHSLARFDRCHLLGWTDSALRFEVVFHVLDPDHAKYADIHHAVNIELLRRFAAERIELAFPTRMVHMKQAAAHA